MKKGPWKTKALPDQAKDIQDNPKLTRYRFSVTLPDQTYPTYTRVPLSPHGEFFYEEIFIREIRENIVPQQLFSYIYGNFSFLFSTD